MSPSLYIKKVKGKGLGVFCKERIAKDTLIEECPLIVLPGQDFAIISSTRFIDYPFYFEMENQELAVVLGFGSIYNHSVQANARYLIDKEKIVMTFIAVKDIKEGEEICINYSGVQDDNFMRWFNERNILYQQ